MKKTPIIIGLDILLSASLFSCGNSDRGDGSGHMYNAPLLNNPQSLDPQFADDPSSSTVIKNLYSGLMMTDSEGNVVCCNAESYDISEDGTVYTFTLRQDNYWFFDQNGDDIIDDEECFPVTSKDYVFALQRVLDPKMQSPYADYFSCIKGAEAISYGLSGPESAEVYSPDDNTLVIVLEQPNAEFLSLMATAAAYPCNREFFDSTKGRYGLDDKSVMSNGAFYVRQWFYDPYGVNNILFMRRNEKNWSETYDIYPSYLSFYIERSEEDIRSLFKDEAIECFTSMTTSPYNKKKYLIDSIPATTLGLVFNPEDRHFSNQTLRKALAYSIDRDSLAAQTDDDQQIAYGIIPPSVSIHGRAYRELVSDRQFSVYNDDAARDLYAAAKEELGIESVDTVKIMVNEETVNSGWLHQITQHWQEIFDGYIGIEGVTAEEFKERIESGDYSIALYPVKGDISMGVSVFREFEEIPALSGLVFPKQEIDENYKPAEKLTRSLKTSTTTTELVEKYTAAEQQILDTYGFIPIFYKNSYLIADKDNEDIFYDPCTGAVDYRLALNYD